MATSFWNVAYFGCLLIVVSGVQGVKDKRLLLHSDDDLIQAVQTLTAKVQSLETSVATQSQSETSSAAKTAHLESVVADLQNTIGYTAGAGYQDNGGGGNTLCLPPDPQWDHYEDAVTSGGRVFGTEYDVGWKHPNTESYFFGKNIRNEDAPCSVCYSDRPYMIMIPARMECYPGWTKEYSGYLMSGHDGHPAPSEFICVDQAVDVIVGGHQDDNGKLLYLVEGICGSLKCPPYINGRELTCVVCTK